MGFAKALMCRYRLATAAAAVLIVALLVLCRVSFALAESHPHDLMTQLARVLVVIENYYVTPVARQKLLDGAIDGMVAQLDPHSVYMPAKQYAEFQQDTEGRFVGIGVEVDVRSGSMIVMRPIPDSPAFKAGIRAGDRIEAVDGWSTRGQPIDRVVERIRGVAGTSVRLVVYRADSAKPIELVVVRASVQMRSVVARRLDGDIAYVGIKQFQRGTHNEFLDAFGGMRLEREEPLRGFILDLRTNSGGLVDEAARVADEFIGRGVLFSTRARGKIVQQVSAKSGGAVATLPLVVLVNQFTASAAELVAGAIQDHRRGVIMGATTFGKGSVQSVLELPLGAAIKLTTMLYYTPSGRCIQAAGIVPDIEMAPVRKPGGVQIAQEKDLPGHLPGPTGAPAGANDREPAATTSDIVLLSDLPADPSRIDDVVIKAAYERLRQGK